MCVYNKIRYQNDIFVEMSNICFKHISKMVSNRQYENRYGGKWLVSLSKRESSR